MPPPRLDPIDRIPFVGGRLCLDFVNTANWVDDAAVDERLGDAAALAIWLGRKGLDAPRVAPEALEPLLLLRQALRRMLSPTAQADGADFELLNQYRATPPPAIDLSGLRSEPTPPPHWLGRLLADSVADLLLDPARARLKACGGARCGWLYLDDSPSGRRLWCSMASCGNRAKARRFYRRQRA